MLLTDTAAEKIKQILEEEKDPTLMVRVFVEGGGCSGFKYNFTIEDLTSEDDFTIEHNGAKLLVDSMSMQYLTSATVDFVEDELNGSHFKIINPNASTTCGCGSSFSV
jgi:iron-sulfur cluster insertion protein